MNPESYRSYKDLPALAGIGPFCEGARIGLSIDDCVARLKRHHWAFRRLHQIFVDRIASEPIYELKMGFSLHAHYCAEHAAVWRKRVAEMREPPLGLDVAPSAHLDVFFDEILSAPSTEALVIGLYASAMPALRAALQRHMHETNRLVDHPSYRICRFASIEVDEMCAFGERCLQRLADDGVRASYHAWSLKLARLLEDAGGFDGSEAESPGSPQRHFSEKRHAYDGTPRRDARFADPYNMAVHAEAFIYDETFAPEPKVLMMFYKRLREIDVPEMMASIITQTPSKPWEYYLDMTRQLWDEARHAMMGEVGFVRAGIDWSQFVRVNFTWSLALNAQLTPIERHSVLYFIEQGLMPKTGKRFEWELGIASGDRFSAMVQDYDWADEVLHARIGRDWYVSEMGSRKEATAFGDRNWSKVLIDWNAYRAAGLTEHENWWPALYAEWCRLRGARPDEKVLAYDTSYAAARADLRDLSPSG